MIVSLGLTIVAFEWKSPVNPVVDTAPIIEEPWFMMEEPKITKQNIPELPKPKVQKQVVSAAVEIKEVKELTKLVDSDEPIIDIESTIDELITNERPVEKVPETPFERVENMPVFLGGDAALLAFLANNIEYPKTAQRMGIEGRVTLSFVIDETGSVTNIEVLRGIGAGCDEEAIRVLKLLPNYIPGKQRGVPVKVRMRVPVTFKLR